MQRSQRANAHFSGIVYRGRWVLPTEVFALGAFAQGTRWSHTGTVHTGYHLLLGRFSVKLGLTRLKSLLRDRAAKPCSAATSRGLRIRPVYANRQTYWAKPLQRVAARQDYAPSAFFRQRRRTSFAHRPDTHKYDIRRASCRIGRRSSCRTPQALFALRRLPLQGLMIEEPAQ